MKIAGYWKAHGHDVKLLYSYEEVYGCDQVYILRYLQMPLFGRGSYAAKCRERKDHPSGICMPLKKSIRSLDRILSCGGKVKMSWDKQRGGERHARIYR